MYSMNQSWADDHTCSVNSDVEKFHQLDWQSYCLQDNQQSKIKLSPYIPSIWLAFLHFTLCFHSNIVTSVVSSVVLSVVLSVVSCVVPSVVSSVMSLNAFLTDAFALIQRYTVNCILVRYKSQWIWLDVLVIQYRIWMSLIRFYI